MRHFSGVTPSSLQKDFLLVTFANNMDNTDQQGSNMEDVRLDGFILFLCVFYRETTENWFWVRFIWLWRVLKSMFDKLQLKKKNLYVPKTCSELYLRNEKLLKY